MQKWLGKARSLEMDYRLSLDFNSNPGYQFMLLVTRLFKPLNGSPGFESIDIDKAPCSVHYQIRLLCVASFSYIHKK
jgi:hypothetical protein